MGNWKTDRIERKSRYRKYPDWRRAVAGVLVGSSASQLREIAYGVNETVVHPFTDLIRHTQSLSFIHENLLHLVQNPYPLSIAVGTFAAALIKPMEKAYLLFKRDAALSLGLTDIYYNAIEQGQENGHFPTNIESNTSSVRIFRRK
jgi:hypothetical protein